MNSASVTRHYHSPLRADQQEQVRERILLKVGEVLADPAMTELPIPEVARRAGVSVRTVYRYFPTKEALYDAFNEFAQKRIGLHKLPERMDELPHVVDEIFRGFDANGDEYRAWRFSKIAGEVRARRKQRQKKAFSKALAPCTSHLDETTGRGVAAIVHSLVSSETWLTMVDTWGMTTVEAAEAVKWAIETLKTRLERERGRRS
jgi:AcrR family transcriptional regulator